jgi:tRNA pseudouridine13 synthase
VPRDPLPFATPDVPGIGGTLRTELEDFFVQELPLYEAKGEGDHLLFEARKVDLTTREAIKRMARALNVPPRDIGYAGTKDRRAVAQQLFSVPTTGGIDEERVMRMEVDGVAAIWADRHDRKLRLGHLAGNRFAVRIRDVEPTAVVRLRPLLDRLARDGVPNYYGEQRFGRDDRRPTDALGLALLRDPAEFLSLFLGGEDHREDVAVARRAYDADGPRAALDAWPRNLKAERRVLRTLINTGDPAAAVREVEGSLRRMYESAAQSSLFNKVVADRLADGLLSSVVDGDVAVRHDDELRTGGPHVVGADAADDYTNWRQSPTGPMPGGKMHPRPEREAADREARAHDSLGVAPSVFDRLPGTRRPLRFRPIDTKLTGGVDDKGPHVVAAFSLPAGSFATVLLRELMKPDA